MSMEKVVIMHDDGTIEEAVREVVPEEPYVPQPTEMDILKSQVTYTAMKTGTLIQTPKAKEARA